MRQVAPLLGKHRQLVEDEAIGTDEIQAGENNGNQRRGQKNVRLARYSIINFRYLGGGALLALIVLHQQTRHCRRKRRQPGLQRRTNLLARFAFFAVAS